MMPRLVINCSRPETVQIPLVLPLLPNCNVQAWERAKVSLESVDESCPIDLSELSRMPLEVEKESMDTARRLRNDGGEVRVKRSGVDPRGEGSGLRVGNWRRGLPPTRRAHAEGIPLASRCGWGIASGGR